MKTLLVLSMFVFISFNIFANSGDTIFVSQGTTPVIDGIISTEEWNDASIISYQAGSSGNEITVTCYLKHNGMDTLYIAQNMPNTLSGDRDLVWLDTQNNGGTAPQTDDYMLNKYHMEGWSPTLEEKGTGSAWSLVAQNEDIVDWIVVLSGNDWNSNIGQIEFAIAFSKLGITPNIQKTIGFGIAFGEMTIPYNSSKIWSWPANSDYLIPNSWGDLIFFDAQTNISKQNYENEILIYPNPTTGMFTIEGKDIQSIEITNITGQVVQQFSINNFQLTIDLSNQAKGVYFVKIYTNNIIDVRKIIIK